MDSKSVKVKLEGYCCKNYQPVKEHLQKMLNSGGEENVQLCVYVKDKCVVDLYGTAIGMYAVCRHIFATELSNYNGGFPLTPKLQTIFLILLILF